ncbi:c-type cytochrome [Polymorphum gilvum]|uniref:Cytochrome c subfamily, putative n=1 Tax=Polymorphum gilvum (strain LMG 25793 / CGMCC 1.9160 / SL003B-26A1) TaxID=991905 RepID=F2J566_POLGS|nr:c-type cytochrome [Polymorphum gilvum]ADZ71125.1 Cytochrome c subfamily, putative [Polymorphum gilvum SL003B-26A1]
MRNLAAGAAARRHARRSSLRPGPIAAILTLLSASPVLAGEADAARGETLYKACKTCHQIGDGARNGVGPHLDALFGRVAGSLDGFKYSSAMKAKGAAGLAWDEATLDAYLAKPQALVPGTRMSFRGMQAEHDRADLIAYLKAASAGEPSANGDNPAPARPEMGAAAMALAGDPAYGEYLSSECVTCHQITGRADGIPSIIGWPKEAFIRALFEYKTNVRSHQVMKNMTVNLGNEEIAALAAYFGSIEPK